MERQTISCAKTVLFSKVKCEQYWGPGQMDYDNITVTLISEIPLEDWTLRDFEIKNVSTVA